MLNTKPQVHWPFGSGEDFWRVFTIYGRSGHLSHVTQTPRTNFRSPDPWRLHMKFGFDWPSGFGEEDLWKWWTDDGACLYYKLTNKPKGSGELKTYFPLGSIILHLFENNKLNFDHKKNWSCKLHSSIKKQQIQVQHSILLSWVTNTEVILVYTYTLKKLEISNFNMFSQSGLSELFLATLKHI